MADPKAAPNTTKRDPAKEEAQFRQFQLDRELRSPSPPSAYRGLNVGSDMAVEYEPNQAAPVDGSKSDLRRLSPFIISVEPPQVFGSEPLSMDKNAKGKKLTGLYSSALRQRDGFTSARASLAASEYVQGNFGAPGPVEEVLARNSPHSSGGTSMRKGTDSTDASGLTGPGKLGEPAIADLYTAVDISFQLRTILSTPPLILLINPQSLAINYTKVQQYSDRTRFGYVFHAWGEEQPKLSIEAKCGAFISGGRGVQYASKRDSAAWQNLMGAFQFYRNNGYLFDTVGKSHAHHFVGALSIQYDQWTYFGHMESFNFTLDDSESALGGVTFSMEFVVSSMIDTSSPTFNVAPQRRVNPSGNGVRRGASADPTFNLPGVNSLPQQPALTGTATSNIQQEKGVQPTATGQTTPVPTKPKDQTSIKSNRDSFRVPVTVTPGLAVAAAPQDLSPFRV